MFKDWPALLALVSVFGMTVGASAAEKQYGPGVTDTEIKIGNTMPYSGPASSYGTAGKAEAAYFAMLNEQGGINGRRINFISRDDGGVPSVWNNASTPACSTSCRTTSTVLGGL